MAGGGCTGWREGAAPSPHLLRTAPLGSAVPGAPAHAHLGRRAGGAALTSSTEPPPHPPGEGRWPHRLHGTDARTDPD